MPKVEIDYSNTIIYKITCNDPNVKDVYVGHTTNFVQRKHAHKQSCINEKSTNNKCKLYDVIRANGGWLNWTMEIIHFFNCKTHYEARIKEQEYFVLLNANLNSIEPMPPKKPKLVKSQSFELTQDISTNNTQKNIKYICEICDFKCSKQSNYIKHISTFKHLNEINLEHMKQEKTNLFICSCSKICNSRTTLWRHKKTCMVEQPIITTDDEDTELPNNSNLILEILKQNQEFKEMILEKPIPADTNDSLIIELLKQNQDFKNLMIEQSKQMMEQSKQIMEQSKQIMELMKNHSNKSL
jgi:hypothetical protein